MIPTLNPETIAILKELGINVERARRSLFVRRTADKIISAAHSYFADAVNVESSGRRSNRLEARKRHATWRAMAMAGMGSSEIAAKFNMNHTSVIHGIARTECDEGLRMQARDILELAGMSNLAQQPKKSDAANVSVREENAA